MQSRQPTLMFAFTVLVGLLRLSAYAGSPIGRDLSAALFLHAVALHVVTFAFATFLVAFLSRATTTRAAQIGLYAQGVLLAGAFVDVGLGVVVTDYAQAYAGVFGGTAGSILAVLSYGAVLAWGVHDATIGRRGARILMGALAGLAGTLGQSFLAIPWPRAALSEVPGWSLHLALASYYALLATLFLNLAVRRANPTAFRAIWRGINPSAGIGFALLPLVGVLTAARLLVPDVPGEPWLRFLVEIPYVLAGTACGAALWIDWRLVRAREWGPLRLEGAWVSKVVALAFALPLGIAPFLAAFLGGAAAWLGRSPRNGFVVGIVAAFAFLVGNLTVVAVAFAETSIGPGTLLVPLDQNPRISLSNVAVAAVLGFLVALVSRLTNRTSGSGRGRASS